MGGNPVTVKYIISYHIISYHIYPVMTSYIKELCTVSHSQLSFIYTFKNQLVLHVMATVAAISRYYI
jgi:hypothetical protein